MPSELSPAQRRLIIYLTDRRGNHVKEYVDTRAQAVRYWLVSHSGGDGGAINAKTVKSLIGMGVLERHPFDPQIIQLTKGH